MKPLEKNRKRVLGPYHKFYIDGGFRKEEAGWRDMTADLGTGRVSGANVPTWSAFRNGIYAYSFAKGDEVWITFHPNHDVQVGAKFYPHVHWSTTGTGTGDVVWGFEYTIAEGHDTDEFPTTNTVYATTTVSTGVAYRHHIAEVADGSAITMPDVDSLIMFRIFRYNDASDTFTGDVFGLTADIHYRADRFATKGKRPDFDEEDA